MELKRGFFYTRSRLIKKEGGFQMNITCIFFGIIFLITGILFAAGKVHEHITAWKNMPEEEKRRIRISPLCRNIGGVIALSGVIFLISGFWQGFRDRVFVISMVCWLVLAGIDLFFIEKKHWYEIY